MGRVNTYKKISKVIHGTDKYMLLLLLCKLCVVIFSLIPPLLYAYFIDEIISQEKTENLILVIIGYFTVFLLVTLATVWSVRISNDFIYKFGLKLKQIIFNRLVKIEAETYWDYHVGDVKNRLDNDVTVTMNFFVKYIIEFTYTISSILVFAVMLLYIDIRMTAVSIIFAPITVIVINWIAEKGKAAEKKLRDVTIEYESHLYESLQNWKDIKVNSLEEAEGIKLKTKFKSLRRTQFLNQLYWHLSLSVNFFQKEFVTKLYLYFIGGLLIARGYITIGTVLIFINCYSLFFGHIYNLSQSIVEYKNDSVYIAKTIEIMEIMIEEKPSVIFQSSRISVIDLSYRYHNNEKFTLFNVSFTVDPNTHLAIVGESGSGKSTLIKLLTGQLEPQEGGVYIGGINIGEVSYESISKKIGIVSQEAFFFNISIRENFLLVKPDASEDEMIICCKKAKIFEFIDSLPEKFDTVIGKSGGRLSGGQKQRLAIARAFLQNTDIIILDESTSALDAENEQNIIGELVELGKDKTIISIAHRLTSIINCDRVIVLKEGFVVAAGTHEELKGYNDEYDSLFEKQYTSMAV